MKQTTKDKKKQKNDMQDVDLIEQAAIEEEIERKKNIQAYFKKKIDHILSD